jgi:hypothetical protein
MTDPMPSTLEPGSDPPPLLVGEVTVMHAAPESTWPRSLGVGFFGVLGVIVAWSAVGSIRRRLRTRAWLARQPKGDGGAYRAGKP